MIFRATAHLNDKAVHMGAINDQELIEFKTGKTIAELIQNDLDAIR